MTTLIFVHGWSVTSTATYGALPQRLQQQADAAGLKLRIADIWLAEYVSFVDSVTMADLVRAFDHALRKLELPEGRFACIAHSAGAPVVREWLLAQRERPDAFSTQRLSHLVMLAPANFGSALAQLGKGLPGRLKSWWHGVQPGRRVLDWLELGSPEALALNLEHIHGRDPAASGLYQFVLIGDRPDRTLYDHINSYIGEDGSDGVVRLAAANLNARHASLRHDGTDSHGRDRLGVELVQAPRSAFRLIPGAAHSGRAHGILAAAAERTVATVLECLAVDGLSAYHALCARFEQANARRDAEPVELEPAGPFPPRMHIHDPRSMLIVRLRDDSGEALAQTQLLLTAGATANPDYLPRGFLLDRQANSRNPGVFTLLLNHRLLAGSARVADPHDPQQTLRPAVEARRPYGVLLQPEDIGGLVHHALAATAAADDLFAVLGAHQTTVLDVVLPRKVHAGVFRLTRELAPAAFAPPEPGELIP